jgi:hypothetical protein
MNHGEIEGMPGYKQRKKSAVSEPWSFICLPATDLFAWELGF